MPDFIFKINNQTPLCTRSFLFTKLAGIKEARCQTLNIFVFLNKFRKNILEI